MSTAIEKMKEQIRAALKGRTTGLTSLDIRERGRITDKKRFSNVVTRMRASGELSTHAGATPHKTRYSLNPAFVGAEASSPLRRGKKKPGRKPGKKRKARAARASAAPAAKSSDYIAALTVDSELVFIRAEGEQFLFSAEETVAIATLCRANFR